MSICQMKQYTYTLFTIFLFYNSLSASHLNIKEKPQTIIITGASGELGGAVSKLLATDYHLILTGRNLTHLERLKEELKANHAYNYDICSLDFVDNLSRDKFRNYLRQNHSSIAGLVLITPRPQFYGKTILQQDENMWLEVFQNTFTGPLEVLKIVLPYLSNLSKIVVISGTTSVQLQPEYGPVCVIRRMWTTYIKALSHQLGPQGISINALSPGVVLTKFHQERIQKTAKENGLDYDEQMTKEVDAIPLRRHANPQEIAQTIQFLLSKQSDFINGINLIIDGGFTLSY